MLKNNYNKSKFKQNINNNLYNKIFKKISLRKNKIFYKEIDSEIKNKNDDIIDNQDLNLETIYPKNKSNIKIPIKKGKIIENKKIKFFNSFLNQKLNNNKSWKVIKVHKQNISFSYNPIGNEITKKTNNKMYLKKNNNQKNKSVLNNYNNNINNTNKLSKSFIIKEDSKLINEYTNNRILKNPFLKQIIMRNINKKKFPKVDLFHNYKNNLSLSSNNDNDKNIRESLYKTKKKNDSINSNNYYNYKDNLIKNLCINSKRRNFSDSYLKVFNLKKNNTNINFDININSFEKIDDFFQNDNQKKHFFINSSSKDSFSQTEKKLNN